MVAGVRRRGGGACAPRLVLVLLAACSCVMVRAEKDSNVYPWGENPNNQFKMYWNNAANVLQDLDDFQSLYIKVHGCVWSECSVDNYDDDGENRDGDEYWFQGRTVDFCANAAYSLYGVLKGSIHLGLHSCARKTYINSFFTYGGADTIMEALGKSVTTVFDDMGDDAHANSVCYEVEDNDDDEHRILNSNSGDNGENDGLSSTMGCSADGQFVVATFAGQTCDGNYFVQATDDMTGYNSAMNKLGCKQLWNRRRDSTSRHLEDANANNDDDTDDDSYNAVSSTGATYLLANSWACDVSLYPTGCPDPYGLKQRYDSVLSKVSNGRNPTLAVASARLRGPVTLLSWVAAVVGMSLWVASYYVGQRDKIAAVGLCPTLWADAQSTAAWVWKKTRRFGLGVHAILTGEIRRLRQERKAAAAAKTSSSSTRSKSSRRGSSRRSKSTPRSSTEQSSRASSRKKKRKKKKKGRSRSVDRDEDNEEPPSSSVMEYFSSDSRDREIV